MGFGIKKAFNGNGGIKLEAAFRFTNTDYIDDVSTNYFDYGAPNSSNSARMSGTRSGATYTYIGYADNTAADPWPLGAQPFPSQGPRAYILDRYHTAPGEQRGNPENDDSYMYLTLSAYKKFNNMAKSYRTINMHQKRKIKASF